MESHDNPSTRCPLTLHNPTIIPGLGPYRSIARTIVPASHFVVSGFGEIEPVEFRRGRIPTKTIPASSQLLPWATPCLHTILLASQGDPGAQKKKIKNLWFLDRWSGKVGMMTPIIPRILPKSGWSLFNNPNSSGAWDEQSQPSCTGLQELYRSYSEAIQKLCKSYPEAIHKLSRSYPEAIQKLFRIYPEAIEKLSRSYSEAIQKLLRCYSEAIQKLLRFKLLSVDALFTSQISPAAITIHDHDPFRTPCGSSRSTIAEVTFTIHDHDRPRTQISILTYAAAHRQCHAGQRLANGAARIATGRCHVSTLDRNYTGVNPKHNWGDHQGHCWGDN